MGEAKRRRDLLLPKKIRDLQEDIEGSEEMLNWMKAELDIMIDSDFPEPGIEIQRHDVELDEQYLSSRKRELQALMDRETNLKKGDTYHNDRK